MNAEEEKKKEEEQKNEEKQFQERTDIYQNNSNLFLSNNNNPFLVSPFILPTNIARTSIVQVISSIISTVIGDLSSIIDFNTFTLCISTIIPCPTGNTNLTLSSGILTLDNYLTNFNISTMYVTGSSFFNYISTSQLNVTDLDVEQLNISTGNI